jgi:hypothetical protein
MVYGIGIYEKGKYDTIKDLKAYRLWKSILQRCYSEKSLAKFPTYRGCKVCDEWIYFQNFAKWFYENYIEGYTIDKDILGNGKIYSPETCCFVPNHINNILQKNLHKDNGLALGVKIQDGKYRAGFTTKGRKKFHVGYFDTEKEASSAYIKAKTKYIKEMAEEYNLPKMVRKSLIRKFKAA